ncbi:MAG: hypothetical protein PHW95_05390 [Patescibacteria group bacterium]|nr:hypothetical protein [Patescibacteria group bacterium]
MSGHGKEPKTGGEAAGVALASQLRPHLFGLGRDDEASYLEALSQLDPIEQSKVIMRVKQLGDPNEARTPEAESFRMVLVTLPTLEARVGVLKTVAGLPDSKWKDFVEETGIAATGNFVAAAKHFMKAFGVSVAVIAATIGIAVTRVTAALVNGDENAARKLDSFEYGIRDKAERLRQLKEDMRLRRLAPSTRPSGVVGLFRVVVSVLFPWT